MQDAHITTPVEGMPAYTVWSACSNSADKVLIVRAPQKNQLRRGDLFQPNCQVLTH